MNSLASIKLWSKTCNTASIVKQFAERTAAMKRKPDLLWILAIIFGLGVITTGYTQSLWERSAHYTTPAFDQVQTSLLPQTNPDQ